MPKQLKKAFHSKKGFSIMGVLIAAGMMGGLALVLAEITGQQHAAQKMADTRMEVNALSQRIVRTLYDGDACKKTLEQGQGSRNIRGSPAGDFTMRTIKNKDGNDIIKTIAEDATVTYGNGLLKVSSIKMGKISVTGTQAEAEMVVVFRRESKAVLGQKTVERSFPVTLNLDTSSNPATLASCVSDAGAYMKGMCTALGGQWAGSGCTLSNPVAGKSCTTSGQMVTGFNNQGDPVCAAPPDPPPNLFDNFVACQNGEMVAFNGGTPGCVPAPTGGGNPLANESCGAGEYLEGFVNGVKVCKNLPNAPSPSNSPPTLPTCQDGEAVGYSGGALACLPASPTLPSCPDGEVVGYNAGALDCLSVPQGMGYLRPSDVPNCLYAGEESRYGSSVVMDRVPIASRTYLRTRNLTLAQRDQPRPCPPTYPNVKRVIITTKESYTATPRDFDRGGSYMSLRYCCS